MRAYMFSRNQIIAASAATAALLLAGCEKASEGSYEDRSTQTAMNAVNATGLPVCGNLQVGDVVINIIMTNIDKGGVPIPSADLANFESSLTPQLRIESTTLQGVNVDLKQTTCDSILIFKGFEKDIRMPITFIVQPNASGSYVVKIDGMTGVNEAYRAAKQQYYFNVVHPRQNKALIEKEAVGRAAQNAEQLAREQYAAADAIEAANAANAAADAADAAAADAEAAATEVAPPKRSRY